MNVSTKFQPFRYIVQPPKNVNHKTPIGLSKLEALYVQSEARQVNAGAQENKA